jgi:DNA-binding beta-propeller fold protein YncE
MEIEYTASGKVRAAISRLGRTEDVQFSPGGGRLAVAAFNQNRLLILEIEENWETAPPTIALKDALEVESGALHQPHGVCWIDERTIVVANRTGRLVIFELPESPASRRIRLSPIRSLGDEANDLLSTPGSVSVVAVGLDLLEIIVCNNYVHHVSRHLVDRRAGYAVIASEILIRDGLAVPDGVAHSPSGRWIAVSNHGHHNVLLFRNDRDLGPVSGPQAVLNTLNYPHGLRFVENGRSILVADAGAPFVHVFRSNGEWAGDLQPDASIRVLSEESFARGNIDPAQGGPKGIDVTRDGNLMVVSCEEAPFAFFDVRELVEQVDPKGLGDTEAESARDAMLRYMDFDQLKMDEATAAIRRATELEIDRMIRSRSWRITAPLRRATAVLRKVAPGWSATHL